MDKLGLQHQFLPQQLQPIRQDMIVVGRALPVLAVDVFAEKIFGSANKLEKPFGLMREHLTIFKNEMYINTGSSPRNALLGELMSVRAERLDCAGAVLNGYSRDTRAILKMSFPTFSWGPYAQDSGPRYKVVDYRDPVEIGAARVETGDIIFGDIDGVCVIPALAATEVFHRAFKKARAEKVVRIEKKQVAARLKPSRSTESSKAGRQR